MKIKQGDINKIIKLADEIKEDDSYPQYPLEGAIHKVLGEEGFNEFEDLGKMYSIPNRWSVPVENVFRLGSFYIRGNYNEPATESQEGQYTALEYTQVKPVEELITVYKEVNNAKDE